MLEISESYTIAKQINDTLINKQIKRAILDHSPHKFAFYTGDPKQYEKILIGKRIEKATQIGGFIKIKLENYFLLLGDGVNIRYITTEAKLPSKHQMLIEFEDSTYIVCTIQMYGGIWLFEQGTNDNPYYLVAEEKVSPLTYDFDRKYFDKLIEEVKANSSVKALLASEQHIPGLGNGTLHDILFFAGINPKTKVELLTKDDKDRLFESLKNTLNEMIVKGGRDVEKDLFGNEGGYKCTLSKKTIDKPCSICGNKIVKEAYMGGNVYYCPQCQPIKK